MKASEFAAVYAPKGFVAWEAAALDLAKQGQIIDWPFVTVTLVDPVSSDTLEIQVASDYLAIGEPDDYVRLPLTASTAQAIANLRGYLLPTFKMVKAIHEQATAKLSPRPLTPNRYADFGQFIEHSRLIDQGLLGISPEHLRSGHKKDVIVGNGYKKGRELIYGWMQPQVPPGRDRFPEALASWRVQPYSNIHGDNYVDYSHGIRLVSPECLVNGQARLLTDVLTDPKTTHLGSDEGVVRNLRYPAPGYPPPTTRLAIRNMPALDDVGLYRVQTVYAEQKAS